MKPANLAASEVFQAQSFKKSVRYISRNHANLKDISEISLSGLRNMLDSCSHMPHKSPA